MRNPTPANHPVCAGVITSNRAEPRLYWKWLHLPAGHRRRDLREVHQVPRQGPILEQPFALQRVVHDIVIEPLPGDDKPEHGAAGVLQPVGLSACPIADEVAAPDPVNRVADPGFGLAVQDVDALVFEAVAVELGRFTAWLDFHDVKTESREASQVAKRLVGAPGIVVQEVGFRDAFVRRDFLTGHDVLVHATPRPPLLPFNLPPDSRDTPAVR